MSSEVVRYLEELGDSEKPVVTSKLVYLSTMNPPEVQAFKQMWGGIDPPRRQKIISRLVDLCEDNLQLDFEEVFKISLKDPDSTVKIKALQGLCDTENGSLIDPMIDLLLNDPSEDVRVAAAMSLGNFALRAELGKLKRSEADRIETALKNVIAKPAEGIEVRRRSIEAISPICKPDIKKIILEAYQSNNPRLQISAIYAMGHNCEASWLSYLVKELESSDSERRFEAAGACGEIGEVEAVPPLRKLLSDPDYDVRLAAIKALGAIGGNEARGILRGLGAHPDERIKEAARDALSVLDTESDNLVENVWGGEEDE